MTDFSDRLLAWYDAHGRHDLPWSIPRTAYRVWISEIMLQQTQVATVIPFFQRFMRHFPNIATLAAAPLDEVLHHWSGLGYYARARNLHRAAQSIVMNHQGEFPRAHLAALDLPGIGRSTAGAVLALAYDQHQPILDGNVKRVLARHHAIEGWPNLPAIAHKLWTLAETHTPLSRVADYTQAIMDLGATVCTRTRPRCAECPVAGTCGARQTQRVAEIPSPRPRRVLPRRQTTFLVIEDRAGAWLLQRRPPAGIWGGLWSFPEITNAAQSVEWCLAHEFEPLVDFSSLATIEHTFTHFHLSITPVYTKVRERAARCMDSDQWLWYNTAAPAQIGLAKPVGELIAELARVAKGM